MPFTPLSGRIDCDVAEDDAHRLCAADAATIVETSRQRSARAVQRISALGEMTGGIAHDFRNILAVIESSLNLIERSDGDRAVINSCLSAAHEGVARGLRLTSRLLGFAKHREQEPRPTNVNDLLKGLEMFLKYGAGSDIRLKLDLALDVPDCLIDPSQFNPAILNLVVNARDAMPDGGTIRISTAAIDDGDAAHPDPDCHRFVRVRVEDTGLGMPEDVTSRIFDPYFTTKGDLGTGLGVPQVSAFVKRMGGQIRVTSAVGRGTVFDLIFPALGPSRLPEPDLPRQVERLGKEGALARQ